MARAGAARVGSGGRATACLSGGASPRRCSAQLLWFFTKAGAFVFGSGLAIVPFLYGGRRPGVWLAQRPAVPRRRGGRHADAGPVVITVAFIGYLVASFPGAVAAAVGVFLPVYLFVVIPFPWFDRISEQPAGQGVRGRGHRRRLRRDRRRLLRAGAARDRRRPHPAHRLVALGIIWRFKVPEPVLIAAGAAAGLIIFALRA